MPGSCPASGPLSDRESTDPQPCNASGLAPEEALASVTLVALLEPPEAAQARALHMRRELRKGLDHGLALMDALDLSPRGLDLMDRAIVQLDALEAPDEDLEPYLAGYYDAAFYPVDAENDDEDEEDDDPAGETSLETAGRGFVRCGADDDEDGFDVEEQHDAEQTYDDGSEDEPRPWRFQPNAWALVAEVHNG